MADQLVALRRRVAARQGVVTRREGAVAGAEKALSRARSARTRRERARELREAIAALAADRRALAALRRELRELREEPEAIGPEAMVEEALPFDAPPPPPPADPFEGRVLALGGGTGTIADGRTHGLVWVPYPKVRTEIGEDGEPVFVQSILEAWCEELEGLLEALAPFPTGGAPPVRCSEWLGRLRVQVSWYDPEGGAGGGPSGDDSDSYEVGDVSSPPAGVGYFPASPRESGGETRRTLTGWTRTPIRLAEILDLAGERLMADDWSLDGVVVEMLWGAPGPGPKGEVSQ